MGFISLTCINPSISGSSSFSEPAATRSFPPEKLLRSALVSSSEPYTLEASTKAVMAFICSLVVSGSSQKAADLVNSRQVWAVERLE